MKGKKLLLPVVILSLLTIPLSARPEVIKIENENYTEYHDIGNDTIRVITNIRCGGCFLLTGVDYPGEWAKYLVEVGPYGSYRVRLRCRGEYGIPYNLQLELTPEGPGDPQTTDFSFTGRGFSNST
ncbi:MAG: hypothetical protein KAX38_04225 [Candidatus Krumholzibacteria bacterium]|nr:hypothetical protein [Candidatus Krumholzibacteria bacterium]